MKIKTTVAALSVLSVLSFGAFAADTINAEQAQSRQAIGTVSVGAIGTSPMDMHEMLNKKAEEQGASSYRINKINAPKRLRSFSGRWVNSISSGNGSLSPVTTSHSISRLFTLPRSRSNARINSR